eukprot:maker-scaffold353_size198981-snap-gene-0.31 protein:Tk05245 transcript:maker-scaffold353_size198981-snap-gene-0.31-mRNA-1 annotation:"dipeptidyl aminopeptidase-like protein 6"
MSGSESQLDDVSGPTMVHKVKSKLGYTEMHSTAPGFAEHELVASDTDNKNWKGITIAILVILVILCGVAVSVVILTPPAEDDGNRGRPFEIADILDPRFVPRTFNGSWISDNEIVFRDAQEGLSILNMDDFEQRQIVINTTFRRFNVAKYFLSPSQKYLLLVHDIKKRYRFSSFAQYTVYEIDSGLTWSVSARNGDPSIHANQNGLFQLEHAQWMPDPSGTQDAIVFVENYSVFYTPNMAEVLKKIFPISSIEDTVPEVVIHGVPDWIYEEDILKSDHALWPSPSGTKLVYVTFNDSLVEETRWTLFGDGTSAKPGHPYPTQKTMKYPKAGTTNPTVQVWVVDLEDLGNLEQRELIPPKNTFGYTDYYFTAVSWLPTSEGVALTWMNREQNFTIVSQCLAPTWTCSEVYREDIPHNGWSTLYSPPIFSEKTDSFIIKAPVRDGDSGYFQQVVLVQTASKQLTTHVLTLGHNEVKSILSWDEQEDKIYFTAIPSDHPSQRHLYSVNSSWIGSPYAPECLTCDLPKALLGRECSFNDIIMSPRNEYFVLNCLGPDVPGVYLVPILSQGEDIVAFSSNQSGFRLLDNNTALRDLMYSMKYPVIEKFDIVPHDDPRQVVLKAKMYIPRGIKKDEGLKYPLVLHVYGPHLNEYSGPGSQLVTDDWKVDFNTFMATKLKYIVLEVDGSGSGGQGQQLMNRVKNSLGQTEVRDQIRALRYVMDNFEIVDADRIAVTGVSYGGYATGMLLSHPEADFLNCGVAVSPVVDWRLYESAYSERFMGLPTPEDNFKGYEQGSLLNRVGAIQGKLFLLAHGMADRNVHFQHSMLLAKTLVEHNVPFEQQVYPDEGHFLTGVKMHLYSSVAQFLSQKCFYLPAGLDDGHVLG